MLYLCVIAPVVLCVMQFCQNLKGYWTIIVKTDENIEILLGRLGCSDERSLFHVFLNSWLYFCWICSARRLRASASRDITFTAAHVGCTCSCPPLYILLSPFHKGAETSAPFRGFIPPGALFAAGTVCSGSRNRSGAERVQRRGQRLALLACPFRVNKTSPNVAYYSSRRSCLWKTHWIHYLPLFPAWNEGCVYRYQHRIFQFGCESWRQKFSSVFL